MSGFEGSLPGALGGLPDRLGGLLGDALDVVGPGGSEPSWLSETKDQLEQIGGAAEIFDEKWRLVWVSSELRRFLDPDEEGELGIGEHILLAHRRSAWSEHVAPESRLEAARRSIPYILANTPQGAEELASSIPDPELAEIVRRSEPLSPPPVWTVELDFLHEELPTARISCLNLRLHDADGRFRGTLRLYGPGLRASVLNVVARGDEGLLERIGRLISPGRHSVAILFADLENSVGLSLQLPSALYFELASSLARGADEVITRHSGVIGKHTGDGVSAFFLADPRDHAHSSAAARAAIQSAFDIRRLAADVGRQIGKRVGLERLDLRMNIGLHWGEGVYMGQISTAGRLEVTALGDETNEAARLQQAARGGEILVSKPLLEQLNKTDAKALEMDPQGTVYELLRDREGLSRKIVRDVGTLPVCAL